MCGSWEDDPSMIDVEEFEDSTGCEACADDTSMIDVMDTQFARLVEDTVEKMLDDGFIEPIKTSIPYSDCGQAMFTTERLIAHNKSCEYCRRRQ